MWGFQPHFRSGLERDVEEALKTINFREHVRTLLIGLAEQESARHQVCIEPEAGPLQQATFEDIDDRFDRLLPEHRDYGVFHSHPRVRDIRARAMHDEVKGLAITEVLDERQPYGLDRWCVGRSEAVNGYRVYPCVGVSRASLDEVPRLGERWSERFYVGVSLADEVILEVLRQATRALRGPAPGDGLRAIDVPTWVVIRTAVSRLTGGVPVRLGNYLSGGLTDALDRLCELEYEGGSAGGTLVLTRQDNPSLTLDIKFATPIHLARTRQVRKLLELGRGRMALVSDGHDIFGLGHTDETESHSVFVVRIRGRARWSLEAGGTPAYNVDYGRAMLPSEPIPETRFADVLQRQLDVDAPAASHLWELVKHAATVGHGTTLVFSRGAAAEAVRLAAQSTPIEPVPLTTEALSHLSSIDGAVLLDETGSCHAIGVILDGEATDVGDPSRGARFNSAIRYVAKGSAPASVVVVVSDDGMVDLVPNLRPRLPAELIEGLVEDFVGVVSREDEDGEVFARSLHKLEEVAFYLSPEQCDRANKAHKTEMTRRRARGEMTLVGQQFAPDPGMNDSFLL